MRCENDCPAFKNIYGTYEMPVYGCALGEDFPSENKSGDDGCRHRRRTIEKMLGEVQEEYKKETIKQMGEMSELI